MKFLLVVDDYLPGSIKVAARMVHDLALELKAQGHQVSICTPDDSLNESYTIDDFEGIQVLRFKTGEIKNVSKVKRAINETLLSFRAWNSLKKHFRSNHYDFIVYYSPTIFFGFLVKKLKNLWNGRSYLILRDIFPQWVVDNGLMSKYSPIYFYFKFFEYINYSAADVIGVQSPSNKEYFKGNKKFQHKLDVLYNWSSVDKEKLRPGFYRERLGLKDKVVFFYGGNIGHAQDMMNLVRLAETLGGYSEIHFLFVGKGDEVELINNYIIEKNLKNINCLPSVNQNEYQLMLSEFDIGLFSLHKDHITHNFPGKLLGYMKHSLPILGSVNKNNDLQQVLNDANAGFVSENGDDDLLVNNAIQLIQSIQLRRKMGDNAYKLLNDRFSVYSATQKIIRRLL